MVSGACFQRRKLGCDSFLTVGQNGTTAKTARLVSAIDAVLLNKAQCVFR
jgi:hypothetical protein